MGFLFYYKYSTPIANDNVFVILLNYVENAQDIISTFLSTEYIGEFFGYILLYSSFIFATSTDDNKNGRIIFCLH